MIFKISLRQIKQNYEKFMLGKQKSHHICSIFICHQILDHLLRDCEITSEAQFDRYARTIAKQFKKQWFELILNQPDQNPENVDENLMAWHQNNDLYRSDQYAIKDTQYRMDCLKIALLNHPDLVFKFNLK